MRTDAAGSADPTRPAAEPAADAAAARDGSLVAHALDVAVYVVVLNLAAWLVPSVITESFVVSVLTAVLLKLVLEVVLVVKQRAVTRLRGATTPRGKVVGAITLWLVVVGSKFVVLELEDLLLGDAVELGGFFSVTGLIASLLLARLAARRLLAAVVDRG